MGGGGTVKQLQIDFNVSSMGELPQTCSTHFKMTGAISFRFNRCSQLPGGGNSATKYNAFLIRSALPPPYLIEGSRSTQFLYGGRRGCCRGRRASGCRSGSARHIEGRRRTGNRSGMMEVMVRGCARMQVMMGRQVMASSGCTRSHGSSSRRMVVVVVLLGMVWWDCY